MFNADKEVLEQSCANTDMWECARRQVRNKRYKSSNDEHGVKDVTLEGEEGQTHVGEDEVLCQEI